MAEKKDVGVIVTAVELSNVGNVITVGGTS